jgi:hypothetical protein
VYRLCVSCDLGRVVWNSNQCARLERNSILLDVCVEASMCDFWSCFIASLQTYGIRDVLLREFFENRLMGSQQGIGNSNGLKNASTIFRIKSYRHAIKIDEDDGTPFHYPHFGDKSLVLAKCIVGGRAGDMVDIMIMTQSS